MITLKKQDGDAILSGSQIMEVGDVSKSIDTAASKTQSGQAKRIDSIVSKSIFMLATLNSYNSNTNSRTETNQSKVGPYSSKYFS